MKQNRKKWADVNEEIEQEYKRVNNQVMNRLIVDYDVNTDYQVLLWLDKFIQQLKSEKNNLVQYQLKEMLFEQIKQRARNIERAKAKTNEEPGANQFKFEKFDDFLQEMIESDLEGSASDRWQDLTVMTLDYMSNPSI